MSATAGCVRESPWEATDLRGRQFTPADAQELARFLRSLGDAGQSSLHQHRRATAAELLVAERSPTRIGTFLLTQRGSIIACVVIDERIDDGVRVATLSKAEVHPDHDRIQTLWNHLCTPLIRAFSYGSFGRLEVEVEIPEDEPLLQMGFARAESERGLVWRKVISR
jgi:hypothetical protein